VSVFGGGKARASLFRLPSTVTTQLRFRHDALPRFVTTLDDGRTDEVDRSRLPRRCSDDMLSRNRTMTNDATTADRGGRDAEPAASVRGAAARSGTPSARTAWFAFAAVLVTSLLLAAFALRARSARDPHAAAVLFVVPFENLTGDAESDVWCDGLTA
jgi:hypothetical protein